MKTKKKTILTAEKKSILFYDLENTGDWKYLNGEQKSQVKKFCHDFFIEVAEACQCDSLDPDTFRGDDAIAYFNKEQNCVNAGIKFVNSLPEMIRRVPYLHDALINPRIIAFNDNISGPYQGAYSGKNIEEIIPFEKKFGKAGTFRVIGVELWFELPSEVKKQFNELDEQVEGKRSGKFKIYEYTKCYDCAQLRKKHIGNILPEYQGQLYKFYSNNMVARNGITVDLASHLMSKGKLLSKDAFSKLILNWCRAYLEMTVAGVVPAGKDWKFKLSYWIMGTNDEIAIYSYSYPNGVNCYSNDNGIKVRVGENIVGKCWTSGRPFIQSTTAPDYHPLHGFRDPNIVAIAALPIFKPLSQEVIGVLCIDTRISGYFSDQPQETNYLSELLNSFTMNLALANYFPNG